MMPQAEAALQAAQQQLAAAQHAANVEQLRGKGKGQGKFPPTPPVQGEGTSLVPPGQAEVNESEMAGLIDTAYDPEAYSFISDVLAPSNLSQHLQMTLRAALGIEDDTTVADVLAIPQTTLDDCLQRLFVPVDGGIRGPPRRWSRGRLLSF